ncbi:MAG: DHH family phosphoesterase, partial [Candidatus Woesearchaeota archaeon]
SPVGVLAKVLSFNLKGSSQDVNTSIKVFTRLAHPDEILKQESPAGKLIWKKYQQVNQVYESLLRDALREEKKNKEEKFLLFSYSKEKISLTKDLANELAYRFPEKLVIVCREKGDEMKCSFRYSRGNLLKALETALVGIEGYGGGHEFACGGVIKSHNFKRFIENLRAELGV